MKKYICIHGHFYQPPRENPWLEEVEMQESANPYHDWNQRISAECYAPNTAARILDDNKKIVDIVDNYSKISFNFGPTLLSWMKRNEAATYAAIIEADKKSQRIFSGHGSAIAQCYNHMIMPLANKRDKYTQIIWGLNDFGYRYERKPEGMWLPETAVDLECLDILAEFGIKYTILAPRQAQRIRKIDSHHWEDVSAAKINPKRPYLCSLPSGRTIVLFFYDGPTSRDIAFSDLLDDGDNFANRLTGLFSHSQEPELVHIATDGETYGHHHSRGDMALASCLKKINSRKAVKLTNYGEFLEMFPPDYAVEIYDNSSWSCVHGIERWRNDCGCHSGMNPGWNQSWRKPLRDALDWLQNKFVELYEQKAVGLLTNIWVVRDNYIEAILDRSDYNIDRFLANHAVRPLSDLEKTQCLKLLEMQRHSMLMYTSCGWFFDEVSGIETKQILQYAARAIQLYKDISQQDIENEFLLKLEKAKSNIPQNNHAANIYIHEIKSGVLDLLRVGAHYAVSSLFEEYAQLTQIYSYSAINESHERLDDGQRKLVIGKTILRSDITFDTDIISYAVLHLGDHNLTAGVRSFLDEKNFVEMQQAIVSSFKKNNIPEGIRYIEKYFDTGHYSLLHLFKDEQTKVLYQILDSTLANVEKSLRDINTCHYPIMQVIKQLHIPLPKVIKNTILTMINADLMQVISRDMIDFSRLEKLVNEVQEWSLEIDKVALGHITRRKINTIMNKLLVTPKKLVLLRTVESLLRVLKPLSLQFDFWKAQNIYFSISKKTYKEMKKKSLKGNEDAQEWLEYFQNLGHYFNIKLLS